MPNPPRRPRGPGGPVSDIERFLMEVERLRKKAAEPTDDVQLVDEVEVVRPAPPPPPPPMRRPPPPRPRPAPPPVLEALPVRQTLAESIETSAAAASKAQATPRVATFRTGPPGGVNAQQIMNMLRSRQQLGTGILLGEILGPPACRRRR